MDRRTEKPETADAWLQRFTPRGKKSIWSKINRQKATALVECGRMKEGGRPRCCAPNRMDAGKELMIHPAVRLFRRISRQRWIRAPWPKHFLRKLESRNRYAILFRIQTVKKTETRARKISEFVAMLERHEKIHP